MSSVPTVTRNLIIINVIFFIATLINEDFMVRTFAMFYPASQYFHSWQILTHMFMHGGFWHILFNMYTLWMFGSVLERMIGEKKFLIFYFVCGLGAVALHTGVEFLQAQGYMAAMADGSTTAAQSYAMLKMTPTLGASGAIYGVIIGYAMLFPESRLTLLFPPVTLSAKWMVIIFAVAELLFGITGTAVSVAHFAHLGGMLFGWLLIKYWRKKGFVRMAEKKKKGFGRFLFGLTARTLMLMNAGVLILSYLSMYVNPAKAWFMTIFGLLFIVFFIVNLLLLFWALRRHSGSFVIPLLALLPSVFLIGRYAQFSGHDQVSDDAVTLVDFNVGKFSMYPSHSRLEGTRCFHSSGASTPISSASRSSAGRKAWESRNISPRSCPGTMSSIIRA